MLSASHITATSNAAIFKEASRRNVGTHEMNFIQHHGLRRIKQASKELKVQASV